MPERSNQWLDSVNALHGLRRFCERFSVDGPHRRDVSEVTETEAKEEGKENQEAEDKEAMTRMWREFGEWGERHRIFEIIALPLLVPIVLIDTFLNIARRSGFPICPSNQLCHDLEKARADVIRKSGGKPSGRKALIISTVRIGREDSNE